jgi:GntR family transcriptional repressor for pyruvate dehydrogenase complex
MVDSIVDDFPLIKRNVLSTEIAELITKKILTGELRPGDKLPTEVEFTQQLGVGRNSLREAIKMLTFIGILEIRRGEGTFVAKKLSSPIINPLLMNLVYEEKTATELVELRLLLDISVIPTILKNLTEEGLNQLEAANETMFAAAQKPDYDKDYLLSLDINFHKVYHSLTLNRLLVKIYEAIYMLFLSSVKESLQNDPMYAYTSHKGLIEALRQGDPALIEKNLRESLSSWESVLKRKEQSKEVIL